MMREERKQALQAETAGIRQIRHKEAAVSFFDPNTALRATGGAGDSGPMKAVDRLLSHYIRL